MEILGVTMQALTMEELNGRVLEAAARGEKAVVANHNSNSVYLYHREEAMRRLYELADVVHIDSMILAFAARLAGYPVGRRHRVTYVDWSDSLFSMAHREGLRVFSLGGTPEVAAAGVKLLRERYPGLEFDACDGYFDANPGSAGSRQRLDLIAEFAPHVLLVGMGMPRQEIWTARHLPEIQANAILMAGACLDYLVGAVPTPPRWMGQVGLEWLYRMVHEPGRLVRRYLVEPWALVPRLLRDLGARRRVRQETRDW